MTNECTYHNFSTIHQTVLAMKKVNKIKVLQKRPQVVWVTEKIISFRKLT